MSTNPYESPPNPYAYSSPPGGGFGLPPMEKEYARGRLKIPAIVLIVLAALTAILRVVAVVIALQRAGNNGAPPMVLPEMVGHGIGLLLTIAVLVGCFKMLKVESYSGAMTAAIISVIPVCSPCLVLGIPFGIWAIIVLCDPRVKAAFK